MCENKKGKKIILFGAGSYGVRALTYYGFRNVLCFADNKKSGGFILGKNIISFEQMVSMKEDVDIVITANNFYVPGIKNQLIEAGVNKFEVFLDSIEIDTFGSNPYIASLKDSHKNDVCFVIGNGPSLEAEDLNVLHRNGVFSFACNRNYLIFDKTNWRPNVYFYERSVKESLENVAEILADIPSEIKFLHDISLQALLPEAQVGTIKDTQFLEVKNYFGYDYSAENLPEIVFNDDASRCLVGGGFSVIAHIQMAMYMGFTKIYLLGIDNSLGLPGIVSEHFDKNYNREETDKEYKRMLENLDAQKVSASLILLRAKLWSELHKYAIAKGVSIYNATRGGKLEEFERVNFDALFK